jgi:hypothetical protein
MASSPEEPAVAAPLSRERRLEAVAVVLWPSFLIAAVETMAFFATFDPLALYEHAEVLRDAFSPRVFGYSAGFFFFWVFTTASSALTLFLARSSRLARTGMPS